MSNRKNILDELDTVTSEKHTSEHHQRSNLSQMRKDINIMTRAMERLVKDVTKHQQQITELTNQMQEILQQNEVMNQQMGDMEFTTGADQNLRNWMKDEADEEAFDVPMTPVEIAQNLENYSERRRRFNMN